MDSFSRILVESTGIKFNIFNIRMFLILIMLLLLIRHGNLKLAIIKRRVCKAAVETDVPDPSFK